MVKAYVLLADAETNKDAKAGMIVYDFIMHDYGIANDDSRMLGYKHVSVTLDSNGGYPSFTVPESALRPV